MNMVQRTNIVNFENNDNTQSNLPKISFAKKQTTLNNSIEFSGIGLHTGKKVTMKIHPAKDDTGIIFRVKNGYNSFTEIEAYYKNVTSTILCTTISKNNCSVSTTEHILSALSGLNVNNAILELTDNEVPVMDGSSIEFVEAIRSIGTFNQDKFEKSIKVKKVIEVKDKEKIVRISPHNETLITCEIGFNSKYIGNQSLSIILNPEIYESQICSARTFGFLEDVKTLREKGLALGGSLENAVVVSNSGILNNEGLRFNDEFVRHKTLDMIGDLALSKYKIIGSIFGYKTGHQLNHKLLEKIFSSEDNWEFSDIHY